MCLRHRSQTEASGNLAEVTNPGLFTERMLKTFVLNNEEALLKRFLKTELDWF